MSKTMNDDAHTGSAATAPATRRSRWWIWVLASLAVLGVLAIAINFGYNVRQQLSPQQLQTARQRWELHGPRDYDLRIQFRRHSPTPGDLPIVDNFVVQVRDRKVIGGTVNNNPLEPRLYDEYDMPGLFDSIEEFLRRKEQPGQPPTFLRAVFDRNDGRLMQFVRRVRGSGERQEIVVALEKR